jgi:hypothetical protein
MIIGTQDKQNMYNVIVQSTLPLYPDYSMAKKEKEKKKTRKDSAKKKIQERKENEQ